MSQRVSGYERKANDLYETPEWVTQALIPFIRPCAAVWEPACGSGKIARVLAENGFRVSGTDIDLGHDFLVSPQFMTAEAIITNPPYGCAQEFCEHALRLMKPIGGQIAMLLRTDFDHAKGRTHLFRDCSAFAKKIVLLRRIVWFTDETGKPKASPSYNHCWMIWDWKHGGPPTISYAS